MVGHRLCPLRVWEVNTEADNRTITGEEPKQRCTWAAEGRVSGGTEPTLDKMTDGQNESKEAKKDSPRRQKNVSKGPDTRHSLGHGHSCVRERNLGECSMASKRVSRVELVWPEQGETEYSGTEYGLDFIEKPAARRARSPTVF